ncbi:MAG: response regulator transcription factor [Chloroflexi bacterium]|nr:response regulator transcription factor [Chloroflexota bacterium]
MKETNVAEVIGDYASVADMLPHLSRLKPDVVILGESGNILNRCLACYEIQSVCPTAKILTLTEEHQDDELRHLILSGASGGISTRAGGAELVKSVGIVANGGMDFDSDALKRLMGRVPRQVQSDKPAALDALTERERAIMTLVAQDYTNEEIGQRLNLSKFTVRNSIVEMRSKLNIKSKTGLAVFAVQHGLLDVPRIIRGVEDSSP